MTILQEKISNKHNDSLWYDGVIATNGQYELVATGLIKVTYEKGNDYGVWNGFKSYDDFPEINDDKDLEQIYNSENGFEIINNNWFEILDKDGASVADIYGNYDEAIEALKEIK